MKTAPVKPVVLKVPPPPEPVVSPQALASIQVYLEVLAEAVREATPYMEQIKKAKACIAELVLANGLGKGATKTVVIDDLTIKVAPRTTYTISQEDFQLMVEEFPEDQQDTAFAIVRWKSELNKKPYNNLPEELRAIADKFLVSKEGKPALTIERAGEDPEEENE